jgi:hypothetical protein
MNEWMNVRRTYRPVYTYICTHGIFTQGTAVAQWLRCCATNRKVAGSIPTGVIGFFIGIKSFRSHYDPGVDSVSNRNECQEYFRSNGGQCVRLTILPPSCAVVTKSGNLNFLEPSGPLRACNGTALPFYIHPCVRVYMYVYMCMCVLPIVYHF